MKKIFKIISRLSIAMAIFILIAGLLIGISLGLIDGFHSPAPVWFGYIFGCGIALAGFSGLCALPLVNWKALWEFIID